MGLFNGQGMSSAAVAVSGSLPSAECFREACFSPLVPSALKDAWITHGGTVASSPASHADRVQKPHFYFCDGTQDPWFPKLMERSITVFHPSWIANAVATNFLVPIAKYVLDERLDVLAKPCELEQPAAESAMPLNGRKLNALKRPLPIDEGPQSDQRPRKKPRTSQAASDSMKATAKSRTPAILRKHKDAKSPGKKIPRLDLHAMATQSRRTTFVIKKVPAAHPTNTGNEPLERASAFGSLLDSTSGGPCVSVADALHAMRDIRTENAVVFEPGVIHCGKVFLCSYADRRQLQIQA